MNSNLINGIQLVTLAGQFAGSGVWPKRRINKFQFEHWWFIGMVTGVVSLLQGGHGIVLPECACGPHESARSQADS